MLVEMVTHFIFFFCYAPIDFLVVYPAKMLCTYVSTAATLVFLCLNNANVSAAYLSNCGVTLLDAFRDTELQKK